ncbi:autophagy protein 16, interacts with Atg12p-Atg5p [Diaporthe eres]|uniref:Autophagy protein 16, interacts with Atg12p-Atg5p n=1 Tax=Diaporthe eres TaxID=83184 RepID=A0ABR1NQC7_DIAER
MPGWKDDYLSSILEAEKNSPVNQELVDACSLLNDRIAALEAEKAHWQASTPSQSNTQQTTTKEAPADPAQSRLRTDLAEALRQKSSLEARLRKATSERDALQATQRSQSRAVRELSGERDSLRLRVGDQAEELRGKKQMLEQMQDEVLALELQLNVAEQQKAKIAAENKQLIERWMRRARQEADDMNAANEKRP